MINAFSQIRLNNTILSNNTGRLSVGGLSVLYSGDLVTGGLLPITAGFININSGNYNSQFIQFSQNLNGVPSVVGNIINNSGDPIVAYSISGASISGFYLNLSDSLNTNNYFFDYLATTGAGFYNLALSFLSAAQSVINTTNNGTITGGGSNAFIPKFNNNGSGLVNSIASGDSTGIYINGNLTFNSAIIPNASFRIKSGQIQCFDLVAYSGDSTRPWRALGVYNGATIWSDPILD